MKKPGKQDENARYCARLILTNSDAELFGQQLHSLLGYGELADALDVKTHGRNSGHVGTSDIRVAIPPRRAIPATA